MDRSLTRTFSVPDDNVRVGQFPAGICDPLTRDAVSWRVRDIFHREQDSIRSDRSHRDGIPGACSACPE